MTTLHRKNTAIVIIISTRVYIQILSSNRLILVEIFKVDRGWVLSDVRVSVSIRALLQSIERICHEKVTYFGDF